VIDNEGHVLYLDHDDGKSGTHEQRDYAYANGNPVGETGHGVDGTQSTELDTGSYSLVLTLGADTPTPAITTYTTRDGDTLQSIANAVYGNPSLWFVIADANGLNLGDPIKAGTQLKIPNNIQQGHLTSDTHKLYNESDIIGSTLPNLKSPPPPSKGGCGSIIMIIIVVVIAVIVTIFTAGLGAAIFAAVGPALGVAAAGTLGSFIVSAISFAVAGAIVAAVGSIVQQGLFIALGYQESFSWNAVGSAAVSGAFTGAAAGLGAAAKAAATAGTLTVQAANYVKIASAALKVSAAASTQLLNGGKITSWTSLAAAAVGGYASSTKEIADAQAAVATTNAAIGAANAAANAAQTLSTIVTYATPWVQLAETYVRNRGELTPSDWAGAVGSTLAAAVTVEANDPLQGPSLSEQLANAGRRLGANLLVAGALSRADKDAAQGYMENAIGQEAGQFIAGYVGKSLQGVFSKEPGAGVQRVYDPNKRAYVDQNGNAVVLPAQVADRYLGAAGVGGESRDTYGNPVTPVATLADSGEVMTDVSPGLLAGSGDQNQNQAPQIETHKLQSGESYWSLAKKQLGPDASNADIQRQVYALMELNPGLDPRTLQVGQSINLIGPNSGTTISAGTLAAYGASDAGYQTDREERARAAVQAGSEPGLLPDYGPEVGTGFGVKAGSETGQFRDLAHDSRVRLSAYEEGIKPIPEKYQAGPNDSTSQLREKADGAFNERQTVMNEVREQMSEGIRQASEARKPGNLTLDEFVERQKADGKYKGMSEGEIYKAIIESSGRPGAGVSTAARITVAIERAAPVVSKGLLVVGAVGDAVSFTQAVSESVKTGDINIAGKEAARITGGWTGAWVGGEAGAAGGAAVGGAIGALFVGVGAVPGAAIGGFIGGIAGGIAGYWGGSSVASSAYDRARAQWR
jgi:LysM repeat protein